MAERSAARTNPVNSRDINLPFHRVRGMDDAHPGENGEFVVYKYSVDGGLRWKDVHLHKLLYKTEGSGNESL